MFDFLRLICVIVIINESLHLKYTGMKISCVSLCKHYYKIYVLCCHLFK